MNRIDTLFRQHPKGILSVYFCAGAPEPGLTATDTIRALDRAGIDMVEIGIPFSDPLADGPVIQQAATQALRGGMSLRKLFAELRDIRKHTRLPLLLMGYLNPIQHFGFEAFCRECEVCGIDGLIIPDLPVEEYGPELRQLTARHGLHMVFLVTPETPEARIRLIDQASGGFVYAVSSPGVTGARSAFSETKQAYFARLKAMNLSHPFLVGFGISNRATREAADRHSAGVIVGSKFVSLLEETRQPEVAARRLLDALNA